jgi:hypothetical protein
LLVFVHTKKCYVQCRHNQKLISSR